MAPSTSFENVYLVGLGSVGCALRPHQAPVGHGEHAVARVRDAGVVRGDDQAAAGLTRL